VYTLDILHSLSTYNSSAIRLILDGDRGAEPCTFFFVVVAEAVRSENSGVTSGAQTDRVMNYPEILLNVEAAAALSAAQPPKYFNLFQMHPAKKIDFTQSWTLTCTHAEESSNCKLVGGGKISPCEHNF